MVQPFGDAPTVPTNRSKWKLEGRRQMVNSTFTWVSQYRSMDQIPSGKATHWQKLGWKGQALCLCVCVHRYCTCSLWSHKGQGATSWPRVQLRPVRFPVTGLSCFPPLTHAGHRSTPACAQSLKLLKKPGAVTEQNSLKQELCFLCPQAGVLF